MAEQNIQLWKENHYLRTENDHYRDVVDSLRAMVSTKMVKEEPVALIKDEATSDFGESHLLSVRRKD